MATWWRAPHPSHNVLQEALWRLELEVLIAERVRPVGESCRVSVARQVHCTVLYLVEKGLTEELVLVQGTEQVRDKLVPTPDIWTGRCRFRGGRPRGREGECLVQVPLLLSVSA